MANAAAQQTVIAMRNGVRNRFAHGFADGRMREHRGVEIFNQQFRFDALRGDRQHFAGIRRENMDAKQFAMFLADQHFHYAALAFVFAKKTPVRD